MIFDAAKWAGRKFVDSATGTTLTIPDSVGARDYYQFGESFIDVGDGYYSRAGGDFHELTEPVTQQDLDAEHCPACGAVMQDSEIALCLCAQCGTRVCEGSV